MIKILINKKQEPTTRGQETIVSNSMNRNERDRNSLHRSSHTCGNEGARCAGGQHVRASSAWGACYLTLANRCTSGGRAQHGAGHTRRCGRGEVVAVGAHWRHRELNAPVAGLIIISSKCPIQPVGSLDIDGRWKAPAIRVAIQVIRCRAVDVKVIVVVGVTR